MSDNHPAKIAKFLLKGWCLLNEYCPNGQNIPLVRSRDGALVCAGCSSSCPHYATHGESPQVTSVEVSPTLMPAVSATSTAIMEVALEGPKFRFNCVRLLMLDSRRVRLIGGSYFIQVRFAIPRGSTYCCNAVEECVEKRCAQFSSSVLLPTKSAAKMHVAGGQITITDDNDLVITLPECDCLTLAVESITDEALAGTLWEYVVADVTAEALHSLRWLEVSVTDACGTKTSIRREVSELLPCTTLVKTATDW